MPTPIGHLLAGTAIAWSVPSTAGAPAPGRRFGWKVTILCAALGALPDLDLLYQPIHRTVTHSVTSAAVVFIIASAVTGWVTGRQALRLGLLCGGAWGSHMLLDWLGADFNPPRGIQALWPFSDGWFISDWDLFLRVERRQPFSSATMISNLKAAGQEIAILGPVVLLLWLWRGRSR